jgi:tetratricopeptide (TPR) repeat protein/V8-like Glu-specific endopeptidase
MSSSSWFLMAVLMGTNFVLVQPAAVAKSSAEVQDIAKAVTVEIKLQNNNSNGSGIIIQKQGDLYTLVTNRHVICGATDCTNISVGEIFTIQMPDGQKYKILKDAIKLLGSQDDIVDLAIMQFRSNRSYAVAKVSLSNSLNVNDPVYTSGFPFEQPGFTFGDGEAIAVVNKRLTGDGGGYTIIYNAFTIKGMSGGGVFDSNGQLVAIHGHGDRFKENTQIDTSDLARAEVDSKIGYNRGIPVRWLLQNLVPMGIYLGGNRSVGEIRSAREKVSESADEHFIIGFNKFVDPGTDIISGKRQAIQSFSTAIQINPRYANAYLSRAILYEQMQDFQKALADVNQVITLKPRYFEAYYNRAVLKNVRLNDSQGALLDYDRAIALNPRSFSAYYNRGNLKYEKLNDIQGALNDYNQAIALNPKKIQAYNNRGALKYEKLNDIQGALDDFNQVILLNPKNPQAYKNRGTLKTDKLNDTQGALDDFNQSIFLDPKYSNAYYSRAILKNDKLNDIQGALADYNQAIILNPKHASAYNNRGILKDIKLNDIKGALSDYDQAIILNPKNFLAYNNRAILKSDKLNDDYGALSDYNQAIIINLEYYQAYGARAALKLSKLNDRVGCIQDLRQAARLARVQGDTQYLRKVLSILQDLRVSE